MLDVPVDVAIVGAGPAGSAAAIACARLGLRVVVLEKARFPRDKVCGCCLSPPASGVLRILGLDLDSLGAIAQRRLILRTPTTHAHLRLSGGHVLSRRTLDHALVKKSRAEGALVIEGARALAIRDEPESARVECLIDGAARSVRARIVLVADGLAGSTLAGRPEFAWRDVPRSLMGIGTRLAPGAMSIPAGEILMLVGDTGYVGLTPLEDGTIDLAAAIDPRAIRGSSERGARRIDAVVRSLLHDCAVDLPPLDDARFRGTPTLTRRRTRLASRRILVIGDGAAYVEPFSGEGMGWALASGVSVAPFAREGASAWRDDLVGQWERAHARLIDRRSRACRLIAGVLARPLLRDGAIGCVVRMPELGEWILHVLARPISRGEPTRGVA